MTALWLCSRWTWEICIFYCFGLESSIYLSVYSPRLGRFSAIISSNAFSIPFSLFSFQDIPIRQMMVCLMMSLKSLKIYIYIFFFIIFSYCGSDWWAPLALSSSSLLFFSIQLLYSSGWQLLFDSYIFYLFDELFSLHPFFSWVH